MDASCIFKAAAGKPGGIVGRSAAARFYKLIPRKPIVTTKTAPGLQCQYFEGTRSKLPDFDSLTVLRDTVAGSIATPSFARNGDYGLRFVGYVSVPRGGVYEFWLDSDDGSALFISDTLVIYNDGVHGSGEVPGEIALNAGLHRIKVVMFQAKGDQALSVSVEGPQLMKQSLTGQTLFHDIVAKKKGTTDKKSKPQVRKHSQSAEGLPNDFGSSLTWAR